MKNTVQKIITKYLAERDFDRGLKQLSEETGIKYLRLQEHLKDPGKLRLFEFWAIDEVLEFEDSDVIKIVRAMEKV